MTPPSSILPAGVRRFGLALVVALAAATLAPLVAARSLGASEGTTVEWPVAGFAEPSGVVYHPGTKSLFIVGDEGAIGEVSLDGRLLRQVHLGGDLEGVTVDPASGRLYVAREGHEVIFEVTPEDLRIQRRFTIDRSFGGDPNYLRRGGDGIEGITFVPDAADPEGGALWVVNQYDPPVLMRLSAPLRSSNEKFSTARIEFSTAVDSAPLSGVTWDAANRRFLIVSALWKKAYMTDAAGKYVGSVRVPGFMPEGLARLPDGRVVIAQDTGGLLLWTPAEDPFRGGEEAGPPTKGNDAHE